MKTNSSIFNSLQPPLVVAVVLVSCVGLSACPRPVAPASPQEGQTTTTPAPAKEEAGNASALTQEANRRLDEIAQARALLQGVIGQVPEQKKRATELQAQLNEAKVRLGAEKVDAEMKRAARELDQAQRRAKAPDDRADFDAGERRAIELMRTATEVDATLKRALAPIDKPDRGLTRTESKLLQTVADQQRALSTLSTATRMAFRSLTVVEQLRRALPRLAPIPTR